MSVDAVPLDARPYETKLESGEADLALGSFPKAVLGLRRQRLYPTTFLSLVRADHPNRGLLQSRTGFLSARHIVVTASPTGHAAHRNAQQSLDLEIPAENVMLRLPSFTAAAVVASQTDGIATLPMKLAKIMAGQLGLAAFKPPVAFPPLEIAQYWHERFHRDAGHKWLRSISFDLFANGKP